VKAPPLTPELAQGRKPQTKICSVFPANFDLAFAPYTVTSTTEILLGNHPLALHDIVELARGKRVPVITREAKARMQASYELTQERLGRGEKIYGVTTGYGESVRTTVPPTASAELSLNLLRFHGCGTGRLLTEEETAAVLAVRLCSLVVGKSGVRPLVAERLCELLTKRLLPAIPAEGSVGASGDLTPLSYVAAVLVGEREILTPSGPRPTSAIFAEHGITPLQLGPKEALALMNGTSVATALAILAHARSSQLAELGSTVTALCSVAIGGNPEHFHPLLHQAKGHPGQILAARRIRDEFTHLPKTDVMRLQDRYSIRCAPQVLGVLIDVLSWCENVLQIELNGVSDNPIVDVEHDAIIHGGNFYGGHVGFAADALKAAVANVADLLDRQLVLLCLPAESGDLPSNLVGVSGPEACTHHGFKAMSISASALTAEALKATMPASVFSRSTESHNQDKVPMATMGSRDAVRVVELTEQVATITLIAACQAIELRTRNKVNLGATHQALRQRVAALTSDRRMDIDIAAALELLRKGELPLHSRPA
jgi:histidine ammonia-lyase